MAAARDRTPAQRAERRLVGLLDALGGARRAPGRPKRRQRLRGLGRGRAHGRVVGAAGARHLRAGARPRPGRAHPRAAALRRPARPGGSAYFGGWYGYVEKDLRTLLGKRVRGRYSRRYCGGGSLRKGRGFAQRRRASRRRCRAILVRTLKEAGRGPSALRRAARVAAGAGHLSTRSTPPRCDQITFTATGAISHPADPVAGPRHVPAGGRGRRAAFPLRSARVRFSRAAGTQALRDRSGCRSPRARASAHA